MAKTEESTQPQETSTTSKLMLMVIPVLTLGIGLLAGLYLFGAFSNESPATEEAAPEERITEIVQLPPLVIHLADPGGLHYLRVGISLGVFNPNSGTTPLDQQFFVPKLKDYLLGVIGQKTLKEVTSPTGRDNLKQEILEGTNPLLSEESGSKILEVYVTEFIVQ